MNYMTHEIIPWDELFVMPRAYLTSLSDIVVELFKKYEELVRS